MSTMILERKTCSSLLFMSMLILHDNVFKFVIRVYTGNGKTTLYLGLKFTSMLVLKRQRDVHECHSCHCLLWYWKDNEVFKFIIHIYTGIGTIGAYVIKFVIQIYGSIAER